jgi:hypothetical protein
LQEFLTRNSQPFAYLDVERDTAVQETLDRLHFKIEVGAARSGSSRRTLDSRIGSGVYALA